MKIVLAFLMIALSYVNAESTDEQKEMLQDTFTNCKEQNGVTDEDIELLKQHKIPENEEAKCFIACLKKNIGIMDDENNVNLTRVEELMEEEKEKDPDKVEALTKVFESCSDEVGGGTNDCEVAAKLMECSVREVNAGNIDVSFLEAINSDTNN